jgi:hypothetical protein
MHLTNELLPLLMVRTADAGDSGSVNGGDNCTRDMDRWVRSLGQHYTSTTARSERPASKSSNAGAISSPRREPVQPPACAER